MSCNKILAGLIVTVACLGFSAESQAHRYHGKNKFRQLSESLPTPSPERIASGSPGPNYWQQRVDYDMKIVLDDDKQTIHGQADIHYFNNSPHTLRYLWLQLDQNIFQHDSTGQLSRTAPGFEEFSFRRFQYYKSMETYDGGYNLEAVTNSSGKALDYSVVDTMMRIDLPRPLKPGKRIQFKIKWNYKINNSKKIWARTGYEYFEKDKNYLYEIAQFFPRMVAYTDYAGWQHKQFIGSGEFTLDFGDYDVAITVPADHVVAATGVLTNQSSVLTGTQRDRFKAAKKSKKPVYIVTPEEALKAQETKSTQTKTWKFKAENVRDFAFASSRKFIWDAQGHKQGDKTIMAMSFYPNEAQPLWYQYSTHAIIHTLEVYSRFTFDYPYPVAISVNGPVGGMEYPMICFNGPRPEDDGTYWDKSQKGKYWKNTKYGLISVIIHEVGHFYFPMIINSDERQWTWMDEGLNTFLQFIAEQEWEENYPARRGDARKIVDYMKGSYQVPIMTNSESLLQFGNNGYAKPATALNILRETIMGRELFDQAFKEYARRWKFKRPTPSDFFRTMEDASGMDLDWFWRGWFYSTDHTDIAVKQVRRFKMKTKNPEVDKPAEKAREDEKPVTITKQRNEGISYRVDRYPELKDFYNSYDKYAVTPEEKKSYKEMFDKLEPFERELLKVKRNVYVIDFENVGGLVMPIVLHIEYEDGSCEDMKVPAEIWRRNAKNVSKMIFTQKELKRIVVDPYLETADTNIENNFWPPRFVDNTFDLYKTPEGKNPMKVVKERKEKAEKEKAEKEKAEKEKAAKEKAVEKPQEATETKDK